MLKIGIYDRYLNTFGGGERYSCKMAEILSKEASCTVDLITDIHSNIEDVSKRLNLDLSKVNLKIFPYISDDYASKITGNYDIFINTTYLSSLSASGRYNIYLCYFPTPFDSDFKFLHKFLLLFFRLPAVWLFKIANKIIYTSNVFDIKEGLYDVKRFMLKRGSWSSGKVVLKVKDFSLKNIYFEKINIGFKNPSSSKISDMEVSVKVFSHSKDRIYENKGIDISNIEDYDNLFFEKKLQLKSGDRINLEIPLNTEKGNLILITSSTFIPSQTDSEILDSRVLGVVLYDNNRLSLFEKIILKILGFIPLFLITYPSKLKFLDTYDKIISISRYSYFWVKKLWSKESTILFPPVDTESFYSSGKEKIILSVGRFFPEHHNKKQLELAQVFMELYDQYPEEIKGYELILAGGLENKKAHLDYVEKIREASCGYPIKIAANIAWEDLTKVFAKAEIFWHAAGIGEDEQKHPEKFEHFGITTVEAMVSGCIPIVINKGGQKEIIKEAVNGFKFDSFDELKEKTIAAIKNPLEMSKIRENAKIDAGLYSNEVFRKNLLEIIESAKDALNKKT
ncbi:MAG: glycosyltransferase [Actinomycetota bacterium]|nr:glycosyltransferase [Actinomycetota bacterium]